MKNVKITTNRQIFKCTYLYLYEDNKILCKFKIIIFTSFCKKIDVLDEIWVCIGWDIAILPKTANKGHFFENQKKSRNTKNFNFLCLEMSLWFSFLNSKKSFYDLKPRL